MDAFETDSYKLALKSFMAIRRQQFGSRYTFEKMAEACRIQKTYLSKVLNSTGNLSADQLYFACEYLRLSQIETDYLLLLRELDNCTHPQRQIKLKKSIAEIRSKNLKSENKLKFNSNGEVQAGQWLYYTDIDLQLVHLFMTVPRFAENPKLICDFISIDEGRLSTALMRLLDWKFIAFQNGRYSAQDPQLHLPEDSPIFLTFAILNRIKTLEKIRRSPKSEGDGLDYFFSVTFSADKKVQAKLKRKLLEFIKEAQSEVQNAKAQDVFQLNIDLFRWS